MTREADRPHPRRRATTSEHPLPAGRPVALVTGGGTGIGLAVARGLARDGFDLVIASRSSRHLSAGARVLRPLVRELRTVPTDVRRPEEVERLFESVRSELGRLDVLVNNAAGNFVSPAERISPNGWRAVTQIVLDGTFFCSRAAFPLLRRSPRASIVNVVAAYAWTAGPGTAHSAAAKAGVLALTRTLAVEWARDGIRVNAVSPGPIRTSGTDRQLWTSLARRSRVLEGVPLKRFGTVEEVAAAVRFLVGPDARYITGATLTVDGGQWLEGGGLRLLDASGRGGFRRGAPPSRRSPSRPPG